MWNPIRVAVVAAASLALVGASSALAAGAGGVTGPAIYVDGALYRTVGTPTDFSQTGAPDSAFDTIYDFSGAQSSVATAGPGDQDFNGGRWRVQGVTFTQDYATALAAYDSNNSGDFDSDEEVHAAIIGGAITTTVVKSFECPIIPVPQHQLP
jgi:hypothetical protein